MMKITSKLAAKCRTIFATLLIVSTLSIVIAKSFLAMPENLFIDLTSVTIIGGCLVGFIFFHGLLHLRFLRALDKNEKLVLLCKKLDVALAAQSK